MSSERPRRLDSFSQDYAHQSPPLTSPTPSVRSQFPFPHHDTSRRRSRRESTSSVASIATSIGGALDTAQQTSVGQINELAQNAISSLLSPPIVRTGLISQSALATPTTHRAPTVRDIPPVTLTSVPHVDSSAFASYLARIGPLFERHQAARTVSQEPASPNKERPDLDRRPSFWISPPGTPITPSTPSLSKHTGYFGAPSSPDPRRRPSARPRRDPYAPTPLSTIPSVYLEENFQLENPRTFDVVSERSDVIPPPPPSRDENSTVNGTPRAPTRKALHMNAILQEKLSWYMDTVEVHLISSIASASQSFFTALGSLKGLQHEAEEGIEQIKSLRSALKDLDSGMAIGWLEIVNRKRKQENVHKLSAGMAQVCDVVERARNCEELVDAGDLARANAELEELDSLISGTLSSEDSRGYQPIDLRELKALSVITDDIEQLKLRIGRGFETDFLDALLTDLRQHVESVPPRDTLLRWASATYRVRGDVSRSKGPVVAFLKTNDTLRPALLSALAGLSASGQASRAATAYREAVLREIKSMIRKHLPSSSDDDTESTTSASTRSGRKLSQQEKSAVLARNLRALEPEAFEDLLVKVYTSVGEALRRVGVQVKVLLDVTVVLEAPKTPKASGTQFTTSDSMGQTNQIRDEVTQALDLSSLLGQAVDVIQTQVTKVLRVRSEQNARMPIPDFLRYFALNRLFTDECEAVSSRGGEGLKEVINSQVREFLQFMADSEKQRIVLSLEVDKWEAKDFGPAEEAVLDRVLEGMNRTPKIWTSFTQLWEDTTLSHAENGSSVANGDLRAADKARTATIDEQRYVLANSSIAVLEGIDRFSMVIASIPSITAETSIKLLDYLRLFNSRCCQLILGAGATRSAGLKNITSKHLALASQACSFVVALTPYMREYVRRQAPSAVANVLSEFDKTKRLFQEHQNSIHEKLVEIMSGRSAAHINATKKVQWDELPDGMAVSAPIEALAKETGTLHRVLSRHVADVDMKMIMIPIFHQYGQEWQKLFQEAVVRSEKGRANMLQAAGYLAARFSKIEESGDLGPKLVSIVKDKKLQAPIAPPAALVTDASSPHISVPSDPSIEAPGATSTDEAASNSIPNLPPRPSDDTGLITPLPTKQAEPVGTTAPEERVNGRISAEMAAHERDVTKEVSTEER